MTIDIREHSTSKGKATERHSHSYSSCDRSPRSFRSPITSFLSAILITITSIVAMPAAAGDVVPLYAAVGLSPTTPFSRPLGIFCDRERGEVYVADTGNHQVVVCDSNGMALFRFFHYVTRDLERVEGEPTSIVVDDQGRIFLTDAQAKYLDVLDYRGRSIEKIPPPAHECDATDRFDRVALGYDGNVYATLVCGRRVAVIDANLEVARVIELEDRRDEQSCMTAIGVGVNGNIYIGDPCAAEMVRIFDTNGKFIRGFGRHDSGFENFSFPAALHVLPNDEIWVVDTIRQIASRFTAEGEFLAYVGGKGEGLGAFNYPSGVATNGDDRLFVLERGGNRYQCFRFE